MRRKHLYTVKELAESVGFTRGRVWQLVKEGKLIPAYHGGQGQSIFFSAAERDRFVNIMLFKKSRHTWRNRRSKIEPDHPLPPKIRQI